MTPMMTTPRTTRSTQAGSGLVEFALGFSVLVVLFMGLLQVAYSMVVLSQLSAAVRGGARYAAGVEFDDPHQEFVDRVRNMVAYGTPDSTAGAVPQSPDLSPEHVEVTWTRDSAGNPETLTVSVRGYTIPLFGDRELNGLPRFTVRHTGPCKSSAGSATR